MLYSAFDNMVYMYGGCSESFDYGTVQATLGTLVQFNFVKKNECEIKEIKMKNEPEPRAGHLTFT